ncbi:MAG: hypothetical protein R2681_10440 [Pyrinomonadaceae bacterium]
MFFLTYGDKGPRVVLVQTLLRLKGIDVRINGIWDNDCLNAVMEYRKKLNLHPMGPIDPKVFFNLIQDSRLKVIDSLDASAGEVAAVTQKEMHQAGINVLMNERVPGRGVANAVDKIIKRSKDHRIGLLRIFGHGNGGNWISVALGDPYHLRKSGHQQEYEALKADWQSYLDYSHYERHRPALKKIKPLFAPFASAEIHSCTVGTVQQKLIRKLADTWGVPVVAGKGLQSVGGYFQNQWGEQVPYTFVMEGELFTAYPNNGDLRSWAAGIEASVPNLARAFKYIKEKLTII